MKKKIILAVAVVIFIAAAIIGISGCVSSFEIDFHNFLNPKNEKNPLMLILTNFGAAYCVIPITASFLLMPKRRQIALPISVTVIISWLTNTAVKNVVRRGRPALMLLEEHSFSFPSGHAMNNAALYSAIIICVLPFCKKRWQKVMVWCFAALPIMIGLTRVYFNVHYISDVVAGWSLGLIIALACCDSVLKKGELLCLKKQNSK